MFQLFFLLGVFFTGKICAKEGYVAVHLKGQFGNQLFEIATAYAYALDHDLHLTVPDLIHKKTDNIPINAARLFLSKVASYDIPISMPFKWEEPNFNYTEIPSFEGVELYGYFQSEKYFKHRRREVLDLFAPDPKLVEQIFIKYPFLTSDALVVGVQIRDYRAEAPYGKLHPTIGRDYYKKAMSKFPEEAIFLVASNNIKYAKDCTQGLSQNIIYMKDSANYIEQFYALSLCTSFIISNSTFGWWAAWLAKESGKSVIVPDPWFSLPYDNKSMTRDIFPEDWIIISYRNINKRR